MRQKCVKMGLGLLGKEERSKMRQKWVKFRQQCVKNARNIFGGEHLLDDTDIGILVKGVWGRVRVGGGGWFDWGNRGDGKGSRGVGGGVGRGKGTGKSTRTRLSKLPLSKLPFSFCPTDPKTLFAKILEQ